MGLAERLLGGIEAGLQPEAMLFIAAGIVIGILVGAAPGIGPTVGMSIMLPFAVRLTPENAIFLLASINVGAAFGNSLPAILVRVPGTPSALLTVIEGSPFHDRGESGRALLISLASSVVGQLIGVLMFVMFVIPLADIAVRLLFPEVFGIVVFGVVAATGLVTRSPWKGVAAIMLGLLLAIPGQDAITGQIRFTFGTGYLQTGLPVIPVVVGLLAFREVFIAAERGPAALPTERARVKMQWLLSKADSKAIAVPVLIGTVVGVFIGIVPGAGSAVASFVAYQVVKTVFSKQADWGNGSRAGLAAVDSSANSSSAGELIPTLALGIPGAPTMVVIMAALGTQGIFAGPQLIQSRPELLYAVFGGMLVGVVFLAILGYLSIPPSIYISSFSPPATVAVTLVLVVVGAFAIRWRMTDVWVCLGAGLVGYFMNRYDYPVAPTALAFILGGMLETSLRRGLVMTRGWEGFLARPITIGLLVLALLTFIGGIWMNTRLAREANRQAQALTPHERPS
jgi:putative tricarboxylic transport membrane protein